MCIVLTVAGFIPKARAREERRKWSTQASWLLKVATWEQMAEPGAHSTARQSSFGTSFNVTPNNFYRAAIKSPSQPARLLAVLFSLFKQKLQPLSFHWRG